MSVHKVHRPTDSRTAAVTRLGHDRLETGHDRFETSRRRFIVTTDLVILLLGSALTTAIQKVWHLGSSSSLWPAVKPSDGHVWPLLDLGRRRRGRGRSHAWEATDGPLYLLGAASFQAVVIFAASLLCSPAAERCHDGRIQWSWVWLHRHNFCRVTPA